MARQYLEQSFCNVRFCYQRPQAPTGETQLPNIVKIEVVQHIADHLVGELEQRHDDGSYVLCGVLAGHQVVCEWGHATDRTGNVEHGRRGRIRWRERGEGWLVVRWEDVCYKEVPKTELTSERKLSSSSSKFFQASLYLPCLCDVFGHSSEQFQQEQASKESNDGTCHLPRGLLLGLHTWKPQPWEESLSDPDPTSRPLTIQNKSIHHRCWAFRGAFFVLVNLNQGREKGHSLFHRSNETAMADAKGVDTVVHAEDTPYPEQSHRDDIMMVQVKLPFFEALLQGQAEKAAIKREKGNTRTRVRKENRVKFPSRRPSRQPGERFPLCLPWKVNT